MPGDPHALVGFYPVRDLAATRTFYERTLGLPLARDQGQCLIFKVSENAYVGFCEHADAPDPHPGVMITLLSDDVDGLYRSLNDQGAETEGAPRTNDRFAIYHFFARDPNGYRVEVQRFLEPLP